ncbi:MAG: SpoIID/LytB domain-containing protein [Actinobacteria bacterium]|nr:MAG: SpoIID/LytB domain-containing protein [Actinomycetota bacterium]
MRRFLLIGFLAFAFSASSAAAAPVFFETGHGWGHGIGMSQYGAQGFALHGWTYDQILMHYYAETTIAPLGGSPVVAVLLASGRSSLTIASATKFTARGAGGSTFTLAAGSHTIGPNLRIVDAAGHVHRLGSPARFDRGTSPLRLNGSPYRGYFGVASTGSSLSAVNHAGLDFYVRGVVPREMPSSWNAEALKVQAVAARSYAYVSSQNKPYLYPDTRDQVYGGIAAETPATNAAVQATAHQVVKYGSSVVQAFFFSTSGGRTCAIDDCWNTAPQPYLQSVADPYDTISPYHSWGPFRYTQTQMRARLGGSYPAGLHDVTTITNPSRRVSTVHLVGASGTKSVTGSTFQVRFGLRSTWFRVAVLDLTPARRRVTYGQRAHLAGFAKGLGSSVSVDQRPYHGVWARVGDVAVASDHTYAAVATPRISTSYRSSSRLGAGLATTVWVRTRVTLGHPAANRLAGQVQPAATGIPVSIQKFQSGAWKQIATATTGSAGTWSRTLTVSAGRYRAQADRGLGYLLGSSLVLTVA